MNKMRRQSYTALFFIQVLFLCYGCIASETKQTAVLDEPKTQFTDDDGKTHNITTQYKRIISLYSAHTENLFILGAGETLIGGHKTCTWPPEAALLPTYDYTGDPEYIIAAKPDLVLIRPYIRRHSPEYIAELEKAGIPVVSLYTDTFDKFDEYIRKLALLTGVDPAVKLQTFHRELYEIAEKTAQITEKKRVFFESTAAEVRTVSGSSLPAYAITLAGGINVAANAQALRPGSSIASFGIEKVLERGDNIDVYIVQTGSMNPVNSIDTLYKRPGYQTIKAVKENQVYFIDEKIVSSASFRFLSGVKTLATFFYPTINLNNF